MKPLSVSIKCCHRSAIDDGDPRAIRSFRQWNQFRRRIEAILTGHCCDSSSQYWVLMLLHEAAQNGIIHGHGHAHVVVRFLCRSVVIRVTDEGHGFDLASVPDPTAPENLEKPTGRGLLMLRAKAQRLRYSQRGRRVTFVCTFQKKQHT